MTNFFTQNLYTVILFPLWIFLLISLGKFFNIVQSRRVISAVTLVSTLYGLFFAVGLFCFMHNTPAFVYEASFPFLQIEDYSLKIGVFVDNLSVLMLFIVTLISFLVQLYSVNYMYNDKSFPRFFAYLNLFNFSMIGLVLSPNLFQNYIFWELVGVSSYLLIGFWYKKPSAADASKKAFIMNRIGDLGLLIGTISVSYILYQYSNTVSLATVPFDKIPDIANYLYSYTNDYIFNLICILILLGAIAKSAQFPLHTWLADAMEGPTPVSALIHSATMVAAGVYLIARLYQLFAISDFVMNLILFVGLFTAFICAFFALSQNDIKRILAYSTNSQLGLMFAALGAGAYVGGLFHLFTHAFFKSMLFLCAGILAHFLETQDIRFMGGVRKKLPILAFCYLIACFSISGIFFSGFYSKEMILSSILTNNHLVSGIIFLLISFMTAVYMFRSYFVVFEGAPHKEVAKSKSSMLFAYVAILTLAVLTILIGSFTHSNFSSFVLSGSEIVQHRLSYNPALISLVVSLSGFLTAYVLFGLKKKLFIPDFVHKLSLNKFYIDNFYDFIAKKIYSAFASVANFVDRYVIDGIVILCEYATRTYSWICSRLQTGNFQSYLAYSVSFLAIFVVGLMLAYTMLVQFSFGNGG